MYRRNNGFSSKPSDYDVEFRGACQQYACAESWCYDATPRPPGSRHSALATSSASAQKGVLLSPVASSQPPNWCVAKTRPTTHAEHESPTQQGRRDEDDVGVVEVTVVVGAAFSVSAPPALTSHTIRPATSAIARRAAATAHGVAPAPRSSSQPSSPAPPP